MTLIELDGVDVVPQDIDAIAMVPAQRASVIVEARGNGSVEFNYQAHALVQIEMFDNPPEWNPRKSTGWRG